MPQVPNLGRAGTRTGMEQNEHPIEVDDPELLPDREVMSILPLDPTGTTYPDLGPAPTDTASATETTGPASGTGLADTTLPDTSAAASGSGEESVTSDDRSETSTQSDSAYAES